MGGGTGTGGTVTVMDPKLKADWVDALRSGRYNQGSGLLKEHVKGTLTTYKWFGLKKVKTAVDEIRHCALGVLCELQEWSQPAPERLHAHTVQSIYWFHTSVERKDHRFSMMIPDEVLAELGLTYEQARRISILSDTDKTFDEVADWIEENI